MGNTRYEGFLGRRMTKEEAKKRIAQVIREELCPVERDVIVAYYVQEKKLVDIARERGVHKSSVCRALHRAEQKLKRFLRY